eukprot:TRINITY_DN33784_c0_g1_i1.p4 TRINITY_DN33784_c0_g1~~TRINITY_DN33784_c0_g1_i1.p4  ORF type:complete len:110 (+),score=38.80 TRINITY_DN33784_c0_g1_i1:99-428(+)
MIRRPPRSTHCISSAASDVYKRQLVKYSKESLVNDQKKINEQFQVNELIEKLMEDNAAKQKAIDRRKLFQQLPQLPEDIKQFHLEHMELEQQKSKDCLLYTSPSPRDQA